MPYFSIVIPVYNKERFVAETLKSVLSQTFTDYEVIIINDGSTDESEARILEFSDNRIRYFSKKNEGVANARNFGIEKASSEYICFLDADDYWYPEFLGTMHCYTLEFPKQKAFASAIEIETRNHRIKAQYSIPGTSESEIVDFFKASQKECVMWTSGVCLHKEVFEKIGVFDTNIKHGEDTELWIRIGLEFPIVFIRKILARYVYDDTGVSRNLDYYFEGYTFDKYASAEKQNPELKNYMDRNRFSAAIKCILNGDKETSKRLKAGIDLRNLNQKRRILLRLPSGFLKILLKLKTTLNNTGLGNSVFR
jgi:glycosyltransferase involved in cell wall biosynthesis